MQKTNKQVTLKKVKGLFAGSFDPIHLGHVDIIERASKLFDEFHVLVASSPEKSYALSSPQRVELVKKSLMHLKNVVVADTSGLVVGYAKERKINCLVRGLRIISDFEYEQSMDWHNHVLASDIETVCLMTRPNLRFVSSRGLKELLRHGQSIQDWVPTPVSQYLSQNKI